LIGTRYGDADQDQDVDIFDANAVATNFDPLGSNPNNGWAKATSMVDPAPLNESTS